MSFVASIASERLLVSDGAIGDDEIAADPRISGSPYAARAALICASAPACARSCAIASTFEMSRRMFTCSPDDRRSTAP